MSINCDLCLFSHVSRPIEYAIEVYEYLLIGSFVSKANDLKLKLKFFKFNLNYDQICDPNSRRALTKEQYNGLMII